MTNDELISREEILAGLPARRAKTLLFLIESQTAQLVARSRLEFSFTESTASDRALAFLEAFALGNALPLRPSIQQIERYAPQWSPLVPDNPRLKAALLQAMSQKYRFSGRLVPNIRAALGLDESAVQEAYRRQYREPLETAFACQLPLTEELSWRASAMSQKLESLPPFWLAAFITIALGLPQAVLALPIACASIGAIATLTLLLALGAINILTMACMAEAIGRSGDFRYGNAFIKQLAANYLGGAGSFILSLSVGIRVFLIALACYLGLSATMANFTAIPAPIWAALLFGAGLYLISRQSLNFTVAAMVLLATINISLLLLLALLALGHLQSDNLWSFNLPLLSGGTFHLAMLEQIFGVSLMLYFGHVYVGECAKLVLPRDPSATALIWGSIAGTAFLTLLFCLWVVAIDGAIAPQILAAQSGTVLEPLAQQVGSTVKVIGTILVTLLLGMAWIRSSSLLVNLAREWFPSKPRSLLMLPRQQGRLILQPRNQSQNFPRLGITYLGTGEQTKFCLDLQLDDTVRQLEIAIAQRWNIRELLPQFPQLNLRNLDLTLEIQSANPDRAYVRVATSMAIAYEGTFDSTTNAELKQQNDASPIWSYLKVKSYLWPLLLIFGLTEALLWTGTQSFTSVLSFAGVLGNSLVGGIFPILLLISSRRKGELVPGAILPLLNHPLAIAGIYSFFLATLFIHGLFIWENSIARFGAIGIATLSLGATVVMARTGAFATRAVIELREEQGAGGRTFFNITAGGKPKTAEVYLGYAEGEQRDRAATVEIPSLSSLRYAIFQLSTKRIEELKLWAHRDKLGGDSESLPALLEVYRGDRTMQFDLRLSGGKVLLPLLDNSCYLKISLPNQGFTDRAFNH